jgi:glycosyltransferase involved in cell wall biosynthesis
MTIATLPTLSTLPYTATEAREAPVRRIAVSHAIHSGGFYGAEKVLCDLVREQSADSPYAPRLLALLDPDQDDNEVCARAEALNVPVDRVHAGRGLSWAGLRDYARALTNSGVCLAHSHGYKATVYHLLSRWMGFHRVPLVVTAHGYPKDSGSGKASLYRWMDIALLTAADCVVAVSGEMERYLRARNPWCRPRTIPNGIAARAEVKGEHPLRAALGAAPGIPIIGTAGRLVPMKNHAMLIRAYARVREKVPCRLVILGDGPLRSSLDALWRELIPGEPSGIFPFQSKVLEWIADMDVFAMPSNDGEGLPIVLLEAGLLSRAAVVSDVGGMPEVVTDRVSGRVFPRGDEEALAVALEDAVSDSGLRASFGSALRREVVTHHDIGAVHARYLEAYAHALAG